MSLKLGDNSIDHVYVKDDLCKLITIGNNIVHADLESMYTPRSPKYYDYSLSNEDLTASDYKAISDISKEAYGIILYNEVLSRGQFMDLYYTIDIGSGFVGQNPAHIWIEIHQNLSAVNAFSVLTCKYIFPDESTREQELSHFYTTTSGFHFINTCIFITNDMRIKYINNIDELISGNTSLSNLICNYADNINRLQLANQNPASTRKIQFKPGGNYSINDINSSYRIYYL